MRLLYCGDIVGRSGRDAVIEYLPDLRSRLDLDFVAVNGENAAHGFGITADICRQVYDAGADCILLGNHAWDQRDIIGYIDSDPRLIRPINYPQGTPGRGEAADRHRPRAEGLCPPGDGAAVHGPAGRPVRRGGKGAGDASAETGSRRHPGRHARRGDERERPPSAISWTGAPRWSPAPIPTCRRPTPRS